MKEKASVVSVFGLPFPNKNQKEIRQIVSHALTVRNNFRIFTPNPEMLWQVRNDASLLSLLCSADLLLPDGIGVLLSARLSGQRLPETVTGIDTAEWLLTQAQKQRLSVFLLGGKRGVAEEAERRLLLRFPYLTICGTHHGYFDKNPNGSENQAVLRKIQNAKPDLLFVCFGFPLQERWITDNTPLLASLRLSVGLGGALDIWSGRLHRAPKIIRLLRCEWLWRALAEPRRWKKLIHIPQFLWLSFLDRFR